MYTGRVGIFFGNKSTSSLKNFSSSLSYPDGLESKLSIEVKPAATTIDGGAQVQQVLNVECKNVYVEPPRLEIRFRLVCVFCSLYIMCIVNNSYLSFLACMGCLGECTLLKDM